MTTLLARRAPIRPTPVARIVVGGWLGIVVAVIAGWTGGWWMLPGVFLVLFTSWLWWVCGERVDAANEPEPYVPVEEPVDACGHDDSPVEPVETDHDGDGETSVIGWLCLHDGCLGRVSHAAAVRRNLPDPGRVTSMDPQHVARLRHRVALARTSLLSFESLWRDMSRDEPIPLDEWSRYVAALKIATEREAVLTEALVNAKALRASGVRCDGYSEERMLGGAVRRHYAVPGECLCGSCDTPDATMSAVEEVAEVRAFDGVVVKRIYTDTPD